MPIGRDLCVRLINMSCGRRLQNDFITMIKISITCKLQTRPEYRMNQMNEQHGRFIGLRRSVRVVIKCLFVATMRLGTCLVQFMLWVNSETSKTLLWPASTYTIYKSMSSP